MKLPRPLWFAVPAVVLIVLALGMRVGIPAYRQWAALQKLRLYGQVDGVRRVGPEWLRRLVGEERMLAFDDIRSIRFEQGHPKSSSIVVVGPPRPVVDDASLACIREFPNLKELDLNFTNVTDAGMEHVSALQHLETLVLSFTRISDAGIRRLKRLPKLKRLYLMRVSVTEDVVAELERALPQLEVVRGAESLDLRQTNFTAAQLHVLKWYKKNLKELRLAGTDVSDASMEEISELPRLEFLDLQDTDVSDEGVSSLKRLTNLKELRLRGTQVSEAGVAELQQAIPGLTVTR